jgi:hypothetical protein
MGGILNIDSCTEPSIIGDDNGETKIVLRIDHAPIHDTLGANVSGFVCGDQIIITSLRKAKGAEALSWRYKDEFRAGWPDNYKFQVPRHYATAEVISRDGKFTICMVQVPLQATQRTMENAQMHIEDAEVAASFASGFNQQMIKMAAGAVGDAGEGVPCLKVCAPVACEVLSSSAPDILPRGAACTVTPYPQQEVSKFVFSGADDYLEVPQAYFHYAAFASGSEQFVCDLQGYEDEEGAFHLIDPVVLGKSQSAKANVTKLLSTFTEPQKAGFERKDGPLHGPTDDRFDRLHPRCGQLCQSFDPMRRGAKCKKGLCGVTCMT